MIRDVESYGFSSSFNDYVTYNRFYAVVNYNSTSIVRNGYLGDSYLSYGQGTSGYVPTLNRRIIPGGPFQTLGHTFRVLVNKNVNFKVSAMDLVNNIEHCYVQFNGQIGSITIGNSSGVLLNTNLLQFPINALFSAEVLFSIGSGTSGAVSVKIPNTIINLTGVNTQNGSRGLMDTTRYSVTGFASGNPHQIMHGIWWDTTGTYNNSWMGDRRVFGSKVNANGDENDFTPVGGTTNWGNVANYPPIAADYNQSSTVGAIELYKGTSPTGVTAVAGAMVSSIMMKTDAGTRSGSNIIKSGGIIGAGTTIALPDSLNLQTDIFEIDPSTNAPFLPSALPLLQRGVKLVA